MPNIKVYLDNCTYNRPFDYTEWQRQLYGSMDVGELYKRIIESENQGDAD